MSKLNIPILERPAFFDGQRLTAADLADVQTYHRELRWQHNRTMHNWGIVLGCAVAGARGESAVQVQPGYALDCIGRELILSRMAAMPIPAVAGAVGGGPATYYLTIRYAEDEDLTPEMRTGLCGSEGAVRRPEEPLMRWRDPDDGFEHGVDIVLASIQVKNCQLYTDVSAAERRDAIPAKQPYVAAGQSAAGNTAWRLWPNDDTPVGVATTVVTTSAGFQATPRYQAHILGARLFMPGSDNSRRITIAVDGYAQVIAPSPATFELVVILPQGAIAGNVILNPPQIVFTYEFMDTLREELAWRVVWMGVEG
jgi:hypothetical protein